MKLLALALMVKDGRVEYIRQLELLQSLYSIPPPPPFNLSRLVLSELMFEARARARYRKAIEV